MAYYKIKDDGTATLDAGRVTVQPTGSFAADGVANHYASITAALLATTPPIAGDFFIVSDLHNFSTTAAQVYTGVIPTPYYIICVDDANMDASRTSGNRGKETCTSTSNDIILDDSFVSGMCFESSDNIVLGGTTGNLLQDCELAVTGSGDVITVNGDGFSAVLINCVANLASSSSSFQVGGGASIEMNGGSVTVGGTGHELFTSGFFSGGGIVRFNGVNLEAIDNVLIANVGSSESADDGIDVKFDMCKIASGVLFTNETFKSKSMRALFTRCSNSSAAAEYQYHLHAFGGDVDDDSAIFRNEDEAFTESNQKISYKIVTNSDASLGSPLWFDFPVLRYTRLSAGATDTLRFYITSNTALTDKDIYIEISYPDGTNKQTPNFLSSAPTTVGGTLDLMATGTTLTTDASSSWTGALSNLYQIDVDTSGDVGADCQPIVKVYVTLPSVTIQIASEYGLS